MNVYVTAENWSLCEGNMYQCGGSLICFLGGSPSPPCRRDSGRAPLRREEKAGSMWTAACKERWSLRGRGAEMRRGKVRKEVARDRTLFNLKEKKF